MKKHARIFDSFSIPEAQIESQDKVRERLTNMIADSSKSAERVSLLSEAIVTHAGMVNRNWGYYLPERIKASAKHWTEPYKRPVLYNHDEYDKPRGRVMGSVYKDITPALAPKDVKRSVFHDGFTYRGLGYLQNLLDVSDPETVAGVLDGRFATVSVSGETDELKCSICGQDWLTDGRCEHRFGNEYQIEDTDDMALAYFIAGNFIWDELSFVNTPADPFAMIVNPEVSATAKDKVLEIYQVKDCTIDTEAVVDKSLSRLFKMYAVNLESRQVVNLSDSHVLDKLESIYGKRIFAMSKPAEEKPVVPAPVKDESTIETPAPAPVAEAPATPAPEAPEAPAAEVPATIETPAVEEKPVEAAPADATKKEVDELKAAVEALKKELENAKTGLADATTQSTKLTDQLIAMQLDVKREKLNHAFDMANAGKLNTTTSEEREKFITDNLAKADAEIETLVQDTVAKQREVSSKLPSIKDATGDENEESIPEVNIDDQIDKYLNSLSDEDMIGEILRGRILPDVSE